MKRKDFKESLYDALDNEVDGMSYDEKMTLVHSLLVDYEKDNEEKRDISNKGCKWSDEELKIILSDAPTKEMSEERKNDSFIIQVKRIAKELGIKG